MKNRIISMLDTTKKKVGAVALCGVLAAAIGTGAVFAANSMNTLQVKMENGVRSYSTDDGKTWSTNAPEGVTVSEEDGKITITKGIPPKDGDGNGMLIKMEDGVRFFSTDGGKTWSQNAPEGVTVNQDGSVTKVGK
ncbi:hypothetical protein CDQ84_13430 [Clostridium thermosuccinogenes]|uniref:Exo-alpha-sialidase n=1 Tax=Clostridium thermosuccinogenes TaxID=84032 RepID=A0A2K2FAZ4_9CLOT|nr:sialidase family protein [Pseudoclostridium thermosuccinogenes]AUS97185.1 hypothetical protein CDO33_12500 [Pseudoclostridium thermosuccinogenes]PNT95928.1 hypothetical protein CDQ85_13300 [Pseudoclostridium thermosuccinogenes]PNT97316.1 hypothetical protein CDQ84_13430 [Pseudoclostridium thermosuccinogenes]